MRKKFKIAAFLVFGAVLAACGSRGGKSSSEADSHRFPDITVPSVYSDPDERMEYVLNHYWNGLESASVEEVEPALSNYIAMLDNVPIRKAQHSMELLFDRICEADRADTSVHRYVLLTQMVSKYLYDPNSPLRNEDYYLPFVRLMAESPLTSEDMRQAYRFEAESCAICQYGTMAPDFVMRTGKGKDIRLYDLKADYTLLFFSNPGCHACKEIREELVGVQGLDEMISEGRLAVVSVYIDEDLTAWREYLPEYPSSWTSGYDRDRLIRGTKIYDVRAIPSLYLLDSSKKVLMKDAPTQKVIAGIFNQIKIML